MTLVEIARYDDLYAARLAESLLVDAAYQPVVADGGLASMDPLLQRALGGVRLSVPERQAEGARALLRRAEAGEFATALEPEDEIARVAPPALTPLVAVSALIDPHAAFAATGARGSMGRVRRIGLALVGAWVLAAIVFLGLGRLA